MDLTAPEHAVLMDDLRRMCAVRTAAREFVATGELVRPPKLEGVPMASVDWRGWSGPFNTNPREISVPAVFAQAWLSEDGRTIGVILVNHTSEDVKASFAWNEKDWGIASGTSVEYKVFLDGEWRTDEQRGLPDSLSVDIPAHTPMLVVVRPIME